jgi:diguanylate cyclase (GGDEF)-like protein
VSAVLGLLSALSRLARRQAPVFIGASILIALASAVSVGMAVYLRNLAIDENARAATHVSYLVATEIDHSLQSVSASVAKVQERLQAAKTAAALDAVARGETIQSALQDQVAQEPLIARIAIVGADGGVLNDSASRPNDGVTDGSSPSQTFADNLRGGAPTDVSISGSVEGVAGAPGIALSRRISSGAGDDLGVVAATLAPSAIDDLMTPFVVGAHGSIALIRADGAVVDRVPAAGSTFGGDIAADGFDVQYVSQRREGVTQGVSAIDGERRLFAIANLPHFPLAVVAAVATSDGYVDWLRQLEWIALRTVAVAALIAVGGVKLAVSVDQLSEARKSAAVQAEMAIHYKRFNSAMDNIVQGVALFDAEMRLITCNRRYAEIYGLPAEVTRPGAASAEGIFPRRRHAQFGDVSGERHTEADGSVATINELPDGRLILQRKKKLAEGGWVSTHEDITARRRAEEKVREMATTDALTGLSNRFAFRQRLDQCLAEVSRQLGKFAIFYLDLDRFKAVNDSLGHPLGDKLLKAVSERIVSVVRVEDTVARLGGDEFAIIQRVTNALNDPARLADRLIAAVGEPHRIGDAAITIGVSIGISVAPKDGVAADELIRAADVALYHAKAERRGAYTFFEKAMDEQVQGRRHMEDDLRTALAQNQFRLDFQPVVSAADRTVKSFEALLRWRHPVRGNVPPSDFIPLAEEVGLIAPIGEWVIREACRQAAKWPRHVKVAVNVSAAQFKSGALVPTILDAIASSRIASSRLIVEVTESVMIGDTGQAIAVLHQIRDQKIMIAMDDFGTGYASLGYLRRFPFDEIKIDRSFVSELGKRDDSVVIVRAIIGMAKALGVATVAEGVESEDQFACLKTEGCDEIQGYLISRPMPAEDVLAFLGRGDGAAEGEGEGAPRPAGV